MKPKKREGTPEKAATPNASQESMSDQTKSGVIFDDEIEKMHIKEDDLMKLREGQKMMDSEDQFTKDVIVRKLKSEEERNKPKLKSIKVLKQAPGNSRVRPMEFPGGVRLDSDNNIIPHSILGDVDNFLSEAANRGHIEHLPLPDSRQSSTGLTVKYGKKTKECTDPMVCEDNALKNWQKKMMERKKQQGYISKMIHMPTEALLMNRADNIRKVIEEQYLIDRTIPYVDYGKGYRVGSEFWKQQELLGDELKGIHNTLSHTEKGYPPVIEHIGVPKTVQAEKNVRPMSASSVNHPWNRSKPWNRCDYLQERRYQLYPLMKELDPHKPDFSQLEVIGKKCGESEEEVNRLDLTQVSVPTIEELSAREQEDQDVTMIDNSPKPGPSLLFDGKTVLWTGDSFANLGELEAEARVTFECYATERTMSTLDITNNGTTVIYYEWRHLPQPNPFDLVNEKVQRFYFNTSSGVILPGDSMKVPFIFKSPNAGIFTEQWQFETKPVLAGGAATIVTLRGVALQEDHYEEDRKEIEAELNYRQAAQVVTQILDRLIDGIRTPERCRSPVDAYITEAQVFERHNRGLVYHHHVSDQLKQLYLQLFPEEEHSWREWDLRVDTINELVMEHNNQINEDGEQKLSDEQSEVLLQKLNSAVDLACYPHFTPSQQRMYFIGFDLLSDMVDSMVDQSDMLRTLMKLPEKEQSEYPDVFDSSKKAADSKGKGKPDPKAAKSPEKKGGKDAKGGGKVSKTPSQSKVSVSRDGAPGGPQAQDTSLSLADSSKSTLEENEMETSYKTKLYSLTYSLLSKCVLQMSQLFDDVRNQQ